MTIMPSITNLELERWINQNITELEVSYSCLCERLNCSNLEHFQNFIHPGFLL